MPLLSEDECTIDKKLPAQPPSAILTLQRVLGRVEDVERLTVVLCAQMSNHRDVILLKCLLEIQIALTFGAEYADAPVFDER